MKSFLNIATKFYFALAANVVFISMIKFYDFVCKQLVEINSEYQSLSFY